MSKSMPDITWPDIQRGRVVTASVECPRCGETALIDGGAFTSGTGGPGAPGGGISWRTG